jgi:8-oxo-dGTP diphosphatase
MVGSKSRLCPHSHITTRPGGRNEPAQLGETAPSCAVPGEEGLLGCESNCLGGRSRISTIATRRETVFMSSGQSSRIHYVVAGLLVRDGMVLLCHRSASREWYPDVWDFPGGHIEEGETPSAALVRELHEELGILIPEPAEPAFAHLVESDVDCQIWVVREWTGTPRIESFSEHDQLDWWPPHVVGHLPLADGAYRSLIKRAVSA